MFVAGAVPVEIVFQVTPVLLGESTEVTVSEEPVQLATGTCNSNKVAFQGPVPPEETVRLAVPLVAPALSNKPWV
jgi:hypothetical protein